MRDSIFNSNIGNPVEFSKFVVGYTALVMEIDGFPDIPYRRSSLSKLDSPYSAVDIIRSDAKNCFIIANTVLSKYGAKLRIILRILDKSTKI